MKRKKDLVELFNAPEMLMTEGFEQMEDNEVERFKTYTLDDYYRFEDEDALYPYTAY